MPAADRVGGRKPRHPRLVLALLLVPAVLVQGGMITVCAFWVRDGLHTRAESEPVPGWRQTTGTITGSKPVWAGKRYVYAPVIGFQLAGQTFTFQAPTSSDQTAIGTSVPVAYNPSRPNQAHDLASRVWTMEFYSALVPLIVVALLTIVELIAGIQIARGLARRRTSAEAAIG